MSIEENSFKKNDLEKKYPNTLDSDLKAEVIAAYLMELGYSVDQIRIARHGIARRGISKDVESTMSYYSLEDLKTYFQIDINREGIYDILPEFLFHHNSQRKLNPDKDEIVDKIKYQRTQEFFARKFFNLFEGIIDQSVALIYLSEIRYDQINTYPDFVNVFITFWSALSLMNRREAVCFLHILPLIHRIRNDYVQIEKAISFILDVPACIEQIKVKAKKVDNPGASMLGKKRLAVNFVLGERFDDGVYDLKIVLGEMSVDRMRDFLETANGRKILDELCKILLPSGIFVEYKFKTYKKESSFMLGGSYLGINTTI